MNIHFVLVRPVVPENIGFVCRALKTMGFQYLKIVDSKNHLEQPARNTAYQSHDILNEIEEYDSLEEALVGIDLVVGTTAKKRKQRYEYLSPKGLDEYLNEKQSIVENVAIVFGSETNGLSTEEEKRCDLLTSIPMHVEYPSINLSHSVMIYCYELSNLSLNNSRVDKESDESLSQLKQVADGIFDKMEIKKRQPGLYQQIRDRMMVMKVEDMKLIMSLARYLNRFIEK